MKNSDRIPALFFILLSLFICQQSIVIGLGTLHHPGPGLLVFGAGAGIGVLAFWFLIRSLVLRKQIRGEVVGDERTLRKGKLSLICLSLFGYAFALNWLGFLLSTFVFILFVLLIIESKRGWRILVKGVLITIGNYLIFVEWLGVNLPKGFLPW